MPEDSGITPLAALTEDVPRRLEDIVRQLLEEEPVIAVHGPRTVGKSTLLDRLARTVGRPRIDLDDPQTRAAAEADPMFFVSGDAPVLIDEYEHVPLLLDAIKAELNRDLRPGRFVLTGSTTYASLPLTAQSLTGRLHRLTLWPLSQGEIDGTHETFLEHLLEDPATLAAPSLSPTSRAAYVARVVRGGMPLALRRPDELTRARWFDDYVSQALERDVLDVSRIRQRDALPQLLAQLAAQTGSVLSVASAARRVDLEPSTAENYARLLEAGFLIHRLPAWGRTLGSRATATPKIHVVDSGLAARLLRVSPARLARRDVAALTEFGHLLETFVVNEVLKQASWSSTPVSAGHFRTRAGAEVDLVLERDDGSIVGVDVKASSLIRPADASGLRSLRRVAGDAFLGGCILHLGAHAFRLEEGVVALPLDRLWRA
jgi:hypothetical protein